MRKQLLTLASTVALGCALGSAATVVSAGTAATTRVSVSTEDAQGDRDTYAAGISADGRYVVLSSQATNLVPGDTNERWDVFVRDRTIGATTRVSVATGGAQAKPGRDPFGGSTAGGISAGGRYVVFQSDAANLVRGDTNRAEDVFVHDVATGRTTRVSVGDHGQQANGENLGPASISSDGRYVAFASLASNLVAGDANDITDVFVRDLVGGRTILASLGDHGQQGDDGSWPAAVAFSANDRYLAFSSWAANLVPGDTNRWADAFVRDFGQ
jgi:Tol biopolymer transport system component